MMKNHTHSPSIYLPLMDPLSTKPTRHGNSLISLINPTCPKSTPATNAHQFCTSFSSIHHKPYHHPNPSKTRPPLHVPIWTNFRPLQNAHLYESSKTPTSLWGDLIHIQDHLLYCTGALAKVDLKISSSILMLLIGHLSP